MNFSDVGIYPKRNSGQEKIICPRCSHLRRKKSDPCLSVDIDNGKWFCHNDTCGWNGRLNNMPNKAYEAYANVKKKYARPVLPEPTENDKMLEWFKKRGISREIIERNKITMVKTWMPSVNKEVNAIAFPYFKDGELTNIKYRDNDKNFRQEKDAEKVFYGYDNCRVLGENEITGTTTMTSILADKTTAYIVEGEMDVLSLHECGVFEVLSVPDGAPAPNTKSYSNKFSYIENCEELLKGIDKFVIAVDNDPAGHTLQAELVRRLGPEKCWTVTWPEGCKDANEVLLEKGEEGVYEALANAKPVPVEGIFEVNDLSQAIDDLYDNGLQGGESTGWANVDEYYTVKEGEWSVVTGIPSHGKSTWVDALMVNLAENKGWNFGIFSPENQPLQRHMASIIQKYSRMPFGTGSSPRITKDGLEKAKAWTHEHFVFILPPENELTVTAILDKARVAVMRYGINGLVIDPWNEIDHSRPSGLTETEYISDCLTKIRRFARKYNIHIWVIAHPTKLRKDDNGNYPVPTPYDIAGAAHWRNKADNALAVWRDIMDESKTVEIHVQKCRFREVGKVGMVHLRFDILTGRYSESYDN